MGRGPAWFRAKKGRRDANHVAIVGALEKLGFIVYDTAAVPKGVDLFVRNRSWPAGRWEPLELKTDSGELTPAQVMLHAEWAAKGIKVHVVESLDEALEVLR